MQERFRPGEFCQALTASAAGCAFRLLFSDYGDFGNRPAATHDEVRQRRRFGTPAFRIGNDLDIAAGKDAPVACTNGRSHRKLRIGRMRFLHCREGRIKQVLAHFYLSFT